MFRRFAPILLLGTVLVVGCGPSVETCRSVLPVAGEVTLGATPTGQPGCACMTEGIKVVVELERSGLFGWKRGTIWIDGALVSEGEFANKLQQAKTRHEVEAAVVRARETMRVVGEHAAAATRGFLEGLSKK